jgi:hypothetical protein
MQRGRRIPKDVPTSPAAREAIRAGKLPTRLLDRIWSGPGIGKTCPICGGPITKNQLQFEIQYAHAGASALALAALENELVGNVEFSDGGSRLRVGRRRHGASTHRRSPGALDESGLGGQSLAVVVTAEAGRS